MFQQVLVAIVDNPHLGSLDNSQHMAQIIEKLFTSKLKGL